jgi:predicted CXXCH cytochrome family protein
MRVRTAKQLAQRIDLYYFTRAHGMRRWRLVLSAAVPIAAVVWIGAVAAAGSRQPFSAGPVARAHAFAEARCEVCHRPDTRFRRRTTEAACLGCHDAPAHAARQTPPPACAVCHQEHRGRVALAKTDDRFCIQCHGDLKTTEGRPAVATRVGAFPLEHPEFAAIRPGAPEDPARVRFNHAVHLKGSIRGPAGPEHLSCAACHTPDVVRAAARGHKAQTTGLMAQISYARHCARCHPLVFDERIDQAAPHDTPEKVRGFVAGALAGYIHAHPGEISRPDSAFRRVPLNFPRPVEPAARNPREWVERRAAADERILWNKTCVECHEPAIPPITQAGLPLYANTNITKQWMPRAAFDHTPHVMIKCTACHAAEASANTSDVLLPTRAACATCHAPSKGAESRCFECHRYHDWTKTHPVTPSYSLADFK